MNDSITTLQDLLTKHELSWYNPYRWFLEHRIRNQLVETISRAQEIENEKRKTELEFRKIELQQRQDDYNRAKARDDHKETIENQFTTVAILRFFYKSPEKEERDATYNAHCQVNSKGNRRALVFCSNKHYEESYKRHQYYQRTVMGLVHGKISDIELAQLEMEQNSE